MGQAKLRGTKEERAAQSLAAKAEQKRLADEAEAARIAALTPEQRARNEYQTRGIRNRLTILQAGMAMALASGTMRKL